MLVNILSLFVGLNFIGSIVGGHKADILEHPYTLALESDGSMICAAAIIGSMWAVTANHCFENETLELLELRALSNERERGGITFRLSEVIRHPEYHKPTEENDIALMLVTESFLETDSRITAINLPQQDEELPVGTRVTVLGWGRTENGEKSDHLRSIEIPIVSFELCDSQFEGTNSDLMICAGAEAAKDASWGDSGGPLVFDNTLYGIVSSGADCEMSDVPGLYTKVSAYREWIEEMTGI